MAKLKELANESVKGTKHEIYTKGSDNAGVTSEHITSPSAPAQAASAPASGPLVVQGEPIEQLYSWYCPACNETMPRSNKSGHEKLARHRMNLAIREAQAKERIVAAERVFGTIRSNNAARLITALFRARRGL